jgi:hypothetical protein
MPADERELGRVVVERLWAPPPILGVATGTILAQAPFVRLDHLVTIDTASRGASHRLCGQMTSVTTNGPMTTFQLKVGLGMIEGLAIKLNDNGITPLVIGVALLAFQFEGTCIATVEAPPLLSIQPDILVTSDAQRCL